MSGGAAVGRVVGALGRWVVAERWTLALFVAALLVRMHWNAVAHPPGDYVYSDMNGYVTRADGALRNPWAPAEYYGFYPWGTHALLAGLQVALGKHAWPAIGQVFAVMGALVVVLGYLVARRVSRTTWVAPAVGLVLVFDYPLVSLGGYLLSEIPFAVGLGAATWMLVRLVDDGRSRDAWLAGIAISFALVMRPQILLSVALVFGFWLVTRKLAPSVVGKLRLRHFVIAAIPIALVLAVSAIRLHHHTGRLGLISENGTFNQVFGRCHNVKITALPDRPGRSRTSFGPPPLIQLSKRDVNAPGEWPQLDALSEEHFFYHGYIADKEVLSGFMQQCIEAGGWRKQAEFALVHVLMLWRYNIIWPDSGKRQWQEVARRWGRIHLWAFAVPAVLMMFIVFVPHWHGNRRERAAPGKLAWVALHLWAAFATAALYFGDVRLRTPYDPVILLLALEGAAMLGGLASAKFVHTALRAWNRRNRGKGRGVEAVGPDPAA